MKFKNKIIKNDMRVHCETKKQAKKLLKWAHKRGFRWADLTSYKVSTNWDDLKENTYYRVRLGKYGSILNYVENTETITFKKAIKNDSK